MSRRMFFGMWIGAAAYTAYLYGAVVGCIALFGDTLGGLAGLVCGLAPLFIVGYVLIVER